MATQNPNPTASSSSSSLPALPLNLTLLISNLNALVTTKLDSTNYIVWKSQLHNILKATKLLGYIDGSENVLAKRFTSLSRSHIHQLNNKLSPITKKGLTMEDFLSQFKAISDEHFLASSPVNDEDLILLILNGLPDEHNAFKTTIRARSAPISLEQLSALLYSESIHVESSLTHTQTTEIPFAYSATQGYIGGYRGYDQMAIGDGSTLPISNTGNGLLPTPKFLFHLTNMLHDKTTQKELYRGSYSHGLYPLASSSSIISSPVCLSCFTKTSSSGSTQATPNWHFRLGHHSFRKLHHVLTHSHLSTNKTLIPSSSFLSHLTTLHNFFWSSYSALATTISSPYSALASSVSSPLALAVVMMSASAVTASAVPIYSPCFAPTTVVMSPPALTVAFVQQPSSHILIYLFIIDLLSLSSSNSHSMLTRSKAKLFSTACLLASAAPIEPQSFQEASTSLNWQAAMLDEYQALQKQCTWFLVSLPSTKEAIGCKWVF
ncbi:uncharacterized protein LOC114319121 [Camellia sinensis]|uniref:uncharacterized protein LOC114319121 n=1 Tax=Camellia sinensis TaxID=4442 RepID=UPI001035863B|nr:uncharacterized protein LOC114319121 [Camellia sinensis]